MANRRIEVEIVGDARQLARTFDKAGRSAKGFGSSIGRSAKNIGIGIAAIGAAAAGLGVVTGRAFSSFEESMDRIVGLAGGARDQVNKFGKEILKLAPSVGKGPQELGEALYFVASAGIVVSKQMSVVTAAAKASAAGLGETQTVADAVTSAMNAYGPAVLNAAEATDVLVATVREGKGEAAAFAPVIGTVAAIASQLGVSFNEVGAALAAQTRLGVSAETSAIQLQAVFSGLLKVAPKSAKALASVGLSHAGLRKELKEKGLLALLTTLKDSFGDNTAAMAQAFPNIRALRGLLNLVGKNAEQVRGVFDRMRDSTGALGVAFGAVSKDEAFKFRQTMSALAVVGIRLGAVFAPVAKVVADGATKALTAISDLIDKLGEAKTVRAKLDVIWEGVTDAARGATDLLGKAVAKIDFDAVWAQARGVADGLQRQLEDVDFGFVGREIGDAITKAVRVAIPAAKELGERLNRAFRTIDFEALGKELGPGLAAAIAAAFVTLLDPSFWLRNWDLAISVALAAIPIGRFAKLGEIVLLAIARPLERLAPRLALALLTPLRSLAGLVSGAFRGIVAVVERSVPLIGETLARGLSVLPKILLGALSPLTGIVSRIFGRLGKIATFVVKVLGIQVAINAVVDLAKKVGRVFSNLGKAIAGALQRAWDAIAQQAIKAALGIIEPFTHLPSVFGEKFRDAKEAMQKQFDGMAASANTTAISIQHSIDSIEGKEVTVTVLTKLKTLVESATTIPAPSRPRQGPSARNQRPQVVEAATKAAEAAGVAQAAAEKAAAVKIAAARKATATAVEKAAKAAEKAAKKIRDAFEKLLDSLDLGLDQAGVTKNFQDDLAVLEKKEAAVRAQIKVEGRTTELLRQLFTITQQQADIEKQITQRRADRRKSRQFEALGLTETGEKKTPGPGALLKRVGSLQNAIKGTVLDTTKTKTQLAQIAGVLKANFKNMSKDVRAAILQMLNDIAGALDQGAGKKGSLTKTTSLNSKKLLAGLGLSPEEIRALRGRLSSFNSAGLAPAGFRTTGGTQTTGGFTGGPLVVENYVTVQVGNEKLSAVVTREQQKTKRRNPQQKRGPNRIGGV